MDFVPVIGEVYVQDFATIGTTMIRAWKMKKRYLIGFLVFMLLINGLWWYEAVYLPAGAIHNGYEAMKESHRLFLYYAEAGKVDPRRYQPPEVISVDDSAWQVRYYVDRADARDPISSPNIYFDIDADGTIEISDVSEEAFKDAGLVCHKKPAPTRIYYARDLDQGVYKDYACPHKD